MDNLSHSFAGLAVGEIIQRSLPQEVDTQRQRLRRQLMLTTCWLASNFPDLDIFLTRLLPAPIGYLLHHRGHTHTLLYVIPQALLLAGLLVVFWPAARRLLQQSGTARLGLLLALSAGLCLHLAMDYLNSYGLHPFHPFDSDWIYGDMVFIVEPVFWVAFGVPVILLIRHGWARLLLMGLLLAALGYFSTRGFLSWFSLLGLVILAGTLVLVQRRDGESGRGSLSVGALAVLVFVAVQAWGSDQARATVVTQLARLDPDSRTLDVSLAAFPAHPLCWNFVSVERNASAGTYRLRRGAISLAEKVLPVEACPAAFFEGGDRHAGGQLTLALAFEGKLDDLRKLSQTDCTFAAWLRFVRAPVVDDGSAFDLRFASAPQGNFTTLRLAESAQRDCPAPIPQWGMPRADLLVPLP